MPANAKTAMATGLSEIIGLYTNELKTAEEPYEWKIIPNEEIIPEKQKITEQAMQNQAYILLATIKNLGSVSFEYKVEGKPKTLVVTTDDARVFFGEDIKSCYDDISKLQSLYEKMGMR